MSVAADFRVPSPADPEPLTAEQLLRQLRARGARIFRMREVAVFTITSDVEVARWLQELGAVPYQPQGTEHAFGGGPLGAYRRARDGRVEWDFYIHRIPVEGEESVWEAAGKLARIVDPQEFA